MQFRTMRALLAAVIATSACAILSVSVGHADEYYEDGAYCRHHQHRLHQYKHLEGRDPSYNCGCSGSYKFPVPPQYTYHWPGLYSQRLMTDYHSPWRFPPIKPYSDEPAAEPVNVEPAKPEADKPAEAPAKTSATRVRLVPVPR